MIHGCQDQAATEKEQEYLDLFFAAHVNAPL
jgi:hypothetical protein